MLAARDRGAIRALILGLLSLPFGLFAPFAIWTGSRSLGRIRRSGGTLTGEAAALLGLVTGIVSAAFLIFGIAYWWLAS
ncbi:MAG TPA: DUF4190 domain-containing protein [Candidatus Acidoferrum sp.]|jgi:hypothetical protein|nr:DUF4190 domain-containing protein [Candidatus Acidoferrum sp.]